MRISVNNTTLFFDVEGTAARGRRRPAASPPHGRRAARRARFRPRLPAARAVTAGRRRPGHLHRPTRTRPLGTRAGAGAAPWNRWPTTSPRSAPRWASNGRSSSATRPAASWRCTSRCATRRCRPGLILCHTAPTLRALPDPHPPAGIADRAGPEAAAVAKRLFAGDFSPEIGEAFGRLVFPTTRPLTTPTSRLGSWRSAA